MDVVDGSEPACSPMLIVACRARRRRRRSWLGRRRKVLAGEHTVPFPRPPSRGGRKVRSVEWQCDIAGERRLGLRKEYGATVHAATIELGITGSVGERAALRQMRSNGDEP